ncbi:hypothetical protein HGM15179_005264, partial [Zosterops borbonicus]
KPEKKIYSCPEVQCSAPAANVSPARDVPKVLTYDDLQRPVTALETKAQVLEFTFQHSKMMDVFVL